MMSKLNGSEGLILFFKIKKQQLIYGMRQIQSNRIKAVLERTARRFWTIYIYLLSFD